MKDKGMVGTILAAVLVIILAVVLVVSYFVTKNYVVIGTQLFPKNQEELDLRDRSITPEQYNNLGWRMPETKILWSVPLSGGSYDSDSQEIRVTQFSESDVELLSYFPNLTTVDAQDCTDYSALALAYLRYPDITFIYTITVAGVEYTPGITTVTLETLSQEDFAMLEALPCLTRVDGRRCPEYELLLQLQEQHPEWDVEILGTIAGEQIDTDARELTVTGASYTELHAGLAEMPLLETLTVHNPDATGEEMTVLREEYPNVEISWDVEIFGNTFSGDATEVDISNQPIGDIADAKQVASNFPNLEKLIVDSTGIENEDMSAYREEVRSEYKVVWTIILTDSCKVRTDDTKFMPIDQGEYYFQDDDAYDLRYCEDMVCIDIGHSTVEDISFVAYMPHLKYLILAWTQVKDITAISNCKELIYLELDHGIVHDYTPLLGCTALEDLNINDHMWESDIEPLTQMTWLKNLFCTDLSAEKQQRLVEALPDTNVVTVELSTASGLGWRCLQNYYDMRDYLGKEYMD